MLAWSVSATDIQELETCFAQADTNKAGSLSLNQFRSALEQKCNIDSVHATQIYASIQKEVNPGGICYTEFLAALMRERIRLHQQSLRALWNSLSGGGEGEISVSNLRKMLLPTEIKNDPQTLQIMLPDEINENKCDTATVEALFQELDPSGTGEILFSSFEALIISLVKCPKADLGVADEEGQRKKLELMVHLIDTELGVGGNACISSAPPSTPSDSSSGPKKFRRKTDPVPTAPNEDDGGKNKGQRRVFQHVVWA